MKDKSVTKVNSAFSPKGEMGQKYLASGVHLSMRLWDKEETGEKKPSKRDYETVGYVLSGKAELFIEGQKLVLEKGDSWVIPQGAEHYYNILDSFSAVEATTPPAHAHNRDQQK